MLFTNKIIITSQGLSINGKQQPYNLAELLNDKQTKQVFKTQCSKKHSMILLEEHILKQLNISNTLLIQQLNKLITGIKCVKTIKGKTLYKQKKNYKQPLLFTCLGLFIALYTAMSIEENHWQAVNSQTKRKIKSTQATLLSPPYKNEDISRVKQLLTQLISADIIANNILVTANKVTLTYFATRHIDVSTISQHLQLNTVQHKQIKQFKTGALYELHCQLI